MCVNLKFLPGAVSLLYRATTIRSVGGKKKDFNSLEKMQNVAEILNGCHLKIGEILELTKEKDFFAEEPVAKLQTVLPL